MTRYPLGKGGIAERKQRDARWWAAEEARIARKEGRPVQKKKPNKASQIPRRTIQRAAGRTPARVSSSPGRFGTAVRRPLPFSIGRAAATLIYRILPLSKLSKGSGAGKAPLRVVCISDTHGLEPEVPEGDLLIHAGDLTHNGRYEELQEQLKWLQGLPHKHKVIVAGNHDRLLDSTRIFRTNNDREQAEAHIDINTGSFHYLQDRSITLMFNTGRNLNVFGSPFTIGRTSDFGAFKFKKGTDAFAGRVPHGTDIMVTHCPPRHYLDAHLGSPELLNELFRAKPRLHVFGHIHKAAGIMHVSSKQNEALYVRLCQGETGLLTIPLVCRLLLSRLSNLLTGVESITTLVNAAVFSKSMGRPLGRAVTIDI